MYSAFKDESKPIEIKIPWNKNTAIGFAVALFIMFFLVLLAPLVKLPNPSVPDYEIETVPLELISFGDGDGTGISAGNLSEKGAAHQGKEPESNIHDAEIAAKTKKAKNAAANPDEAGDFVAKKTLSSDAKNVKDLNGSSYRNVGATDGSPDGTGLAETGKGPGAGLGFGSIEWGGGGNRAVLYKILPKYPKGVKTDAVIKIKFKVTKDGYVTDMIPLQKGDPLLEDAAMKALKRWRFNPLKEDKDMYGIITFTFKVS